MNPYRRHDDDKLSELARRLRLARIVSEPLNGELTRRAEIRLERGEFGAGHEADWYEPRQYGQGGPR